MTTARKSASTEASEALDALKEALNPTLANRGGQEIRRVRNERLSDFTDEYAEVIRKALRALDALESGDLVKEIVVPDPYEPGGIMDYAVGKTEGFNEALDKLKQIAEGKENE